MAAIAPRRRVFSRWKANGFSSCRSHKSSWQRCLQSGTASLVPKSSNKIKKTIWHWGIRMGRAVLRSCRRGVVECCGDNNHCRTAATFPRPGSQTDVMGVIRRSKGVTIQRSWAVSYTAGLYTNIRKWPRMASNSLQRRPWRKLKRVVSGLTVATSVSNKEPNRKLKLITISLSTRIKTNK